MAALLKIEACSCTNSSKSLAFSRHLRSGFRRMVPVPEQGASTNTLSILKLRRLTRSSRSLLMAAVCTLLKPLRAKRGLSASKRWPEVSKAYRRPVDRMSAPMAKVLPPAPAQKSATISPRFAPTRAASSCEPSSCTSKSPASKPGNLNSEGLPSSRKPSGEKGVGSLLIALACKAFCTGPRLAFSALTRMSSVAGVFKALAKAVKPSPTWFLSGFTNHCGKLCRCRSKKSSSLAASQMASQAVSWGVSDEAINSRGP